MVCKKKGKGKITLSLCAAPSPSTLWAQEGFVALDFSLQAVCGLLGHSPEGQKAGTFVQHYLMRGVSSLCVTVPVS